MQKIKKDRIKHMHGVAEYMYNHAPKYELDPNEMYILGLLHDIGYINGKDSHESFGASILCGLGMSSVITDTINWHGVTPIEYIDTYLCFEDNIPKQLLLLWEADMHVDLTGKDIGYIKRLQGIKEKYGIDSDAFRICSETIDWLINHKIY